MEDLLKQAILNIRRRVFPSSVSKTTTTPEPHIHLYKVLQVFDIPDEEVDSKVKFIYDYLREKGDPQEQIIKIHSQIGALSSENLVSRVHKYCQLHKAAHDARLQYNNLKREINALGPQKPERV